MGAQRDLRGSAAPQGSLGPAPGAADSVVPGSALLCAACGQPITHESARIEMAGSHAHSFVNPDGLAFRIGCFGQAAGMRIVGESSSEASWFPGYRWQVEVCGRCRQQLGWLFRAGEARFHGLILDQLREAGS
jgi:hypothetical protein